VYDKCPEEPYEESLGKWKDYDLPETKESDEENEPLLFFRYNLNSISY
jgi:hypothetical protein